MPVVKKVEFTGEETLMCDIQVENQCFYANGVVVHNSTIQLGEALKKKGIDTGEYSEKTGNMKVGKDALGKVNHPIAKAILERSSIKTQLKNYASKFTTEPEGHIAYKLFDVATGRLASGNKDNDFFFNLNIQNLTKPGQILFEAVPSNKPDHILGYEFLIRDDEYIKANPDNYYVEGYDQGINIRKAITVPHKEVDGKKTPNVDEWYFVSIDYSGQELKLQGMFSNERVYVDAFANGEDVHMKTAMAVWGDPKKRKLGKQLNFAMQYGGSWYTVRDMGFSEPEAKKIAKDFWNGLSSLATHQAKLIKKGKESLNGTAYTYYGRPRRFKAYFDSDKFLDVKEGERGYLNHSIQGTGGDIIRKVLVELYDKYFSKPETFESFRFVGTVHDEIDFVIRKDKYHEWIDKILGIMEKHEDDWELPLTCETEVGHSFGYMFVFVKDKDGKWLPKRA
jgi:DNA polymerase I-like protein with 3'-5' exonuclease and polymerase domains